MSNNFNFFEWMRNGVKSAVLLGVSDAVEEIGMPTEAEGSDNNMLGFLQNAKTQKISNSMHLHLIFLHCPSVKYLPTFDGTMDSILI